MSAPMHTLGPWGWDYNRGGLAIFSGDDLVAEINADCPIAKADASLIAAAPELLEALRGLRWKSADRDNMEFEARVTYSEMNAIRAAIAKATGAA